MPGSLRKLLSQDIGRTSRSLIFFILFCLYLWFVVDLRFLYSGGGIATNFPVYFNGWAFFQGFLAHPGGPLEYLAALLSQLFYISWAGALVVTLQAWLMSMCIGCILKTMNLPGLRWLRFIPPIILLITYTQYAFHFVTTTAFLAALLFTCLYLKTTSPLASNCVRFAALLILSAASYYIAGGACLFFVLLCAIYESLVMRRHFLGLSYLVCAATVPYVGGVLILRVGVIDAFTNLLPLSWKILSFADRRRLIIAVYILYLFVPLTVLSSGLWRKVPSPKMQIRFSSFSKIPSVNWFIELLILIVIASAAISLSHDGEQKAEFEAVYSAYHKAWPQILTKARRSPGSFTIIHASNRALYHMGRLSHHMFFYPQHSEALFLTAKQHEFEYWKQFDFYIDIGLINIAENALAESMEIYGEHPLILQRLALIRMVKGDISTARIYLGALCKTLFHADWANRYIARLRADPNLSTDREVQHLRSMMLEKDFGFFDFEIEDLLSQLLEKNRKNRMAFEYLMAWYMLTKQLDKFVLNLERLDDFDYPTIPRAYEEAMLVYVHSKRQSLDLRGRRLNAESQQRFENFNQILNRHRGNVQAAYGELARGYLNSYFFYYVYSSLGKDK
jgi:hypothetical protein